MVVPVGTGRTDDFGALADRLLPNDAFPSWWWIAGEAGCLERFPTMLNCRHHPAGDR